MRCENEVCTYPITVIRLVSVYSRPNQKTCQAANLSYWFLIVNFSYSIIIPAQLSGKKHVFCVLKNWRVLGFCLPKGKNRQIECCSCWYEKCPSKKNLQEQMYRNCTEEKCFCWLFSLSHGSISRLIDHRRARCSWTVLALKMWLR